MVSLASHESTLRLLIERLRWPVRVVRWKTAQQYAALMSKGSQQSRMARGVYFEWLNARELESEVISGLAVLQCMDAADLPEFSLVRNSISAPSILADEILQSLYGVGNIRGGWAKRHSGPPPASFEQAKYFRENITGHIPGHLSFRFRRIQAGTGFPLMRQWAFEWKSLMDATKSPHSSFPYYFLDHVEHRRGISGQFSLRQCDVYRSSFLRTIAYAVDRGMPMDLAQDIATETLLVNEDFVKLKTVERPAWLGDDPERCTREGASLEDECRDILRKAAAESISVVNLKSPVSRDVEKYGELRLSAVLATQDFTVVEDNPEAYFDREWWKLGDSSSLNHELPVRDVPDIDKPGRTGHCRPLTVEVWPAPNGFWHNDFFHTGIATPASYLCDPTPRVECHGTSLQFLSGTQSVGSWIVWNDQWSNVYPNEGHPRCGMLTTIAPSLIDEAATRYGLRLGWIAELRTWRSKNDYDNYEMSRRIIFFWDCPA